MINLRFKPGIKWIAWDDCGIPSVFNVKPIMHSLGWSSQSTYVMAYDLDYLYIPRPKCSWKESARKIIDGYIQYKDGDL